MTHDCQTCRHYLGDGQCAVSMEMECADGGHEAWEAGDERDKDRA